MEENMNIVYSSSDSYAPLAGISLYSLLRSNKDADEINIYIVENQICDENKDKFRQLANDFNRNLTFIPIADIEKLVGTSIDIGRWNISTFGRLFEASLLPQSVEKVIHVDCDTMITDSLEPLWNMDMTGKTVAGAIECIGDSFKKELGLEINDTYINAGNIMLNLKKIREDNIESKFIDYIAKHSQLSFVDQAVLNACVPSDEKLVVPLRYNAYSMIYYVNYKNLKRVKHLTNYCEKAEVDEAVQNPAIVHFTTCFMDGTRPWMENNIHPRLPQYLEFKSNSPWADEPLWSDNRGAIKKLAPKLFRALPQGFVASCIGFVHGVLMPIKNKLKK